MSVVVDVLSVGFLAWRRVPHVVLFGGLLDSGYLFFRMEVVLWGSIRSGFVCGPVGVESFAVGVRGFSVSGGDIGGRGCWRDGVGLQPWGR